MVIFNTTSAEIKTKLADIVILKMIIILHQLKIAQLCFKIGQTLPIIPYRTDISGIRPENLENAQDFKTVRNDVAKLIRDDKNPKIVVGHSIENDISTLFLQLQIPYKLRRDTSELFPIDGKTPSLKSLAEKYLNKENFQVKNSISNT